MDGWWDRQSDYFKQFANKPHKNTCLLSNTLLMGCVPTPSYAITCRNVSADLVHVRRQGYWHETI